MPLRPTTSPTGGISIDPVPNPNGDADASCGRPFFLYGGGGWAAWVCPEPENERICSKPGEREALGPGERRNIPEAGARRVKNCRLVEAKEGAYKRTLNVWCLRDAACCPLRFLSGTANPKFKIQNSEFIASLHFRVAACGGLARCGPPPPGGCGPPIAYAIDHA